jgi:hypothetical protein
MHGLNKQWGASVARRPPGRAYLLLSSECHNRVVVIGNCKIDPITVVSCRAKIASLATRRSCFAPIKSTHLKSQSELVVICVFGGGAGYRPRVRKVITNDVYHHSWFPSVLNICLVSVGFKLAVDRGGK